MDKLAVPLQQTKMGRFLYGETVEAEIGREGYQHQGFQRSLRITGEIMQRVRTRSGNIRILAFSVDSTPPFYEAFQRISQNAGIDFIDGVPQAFHEAEARGVITRAADRAHWNELGHRLTADTLIAYLRATGTSAQSDTGTRPQQEAASHSFLPCTVMFAAGWYGVERNGSDWSRWTDGRGQLYVYSQQPLEVLLQGKLFSAQRPNRIDILVNGEAMATRPMIEDRFHTFTPVPLSLKAGENQITWVSQNPGIRLPHDTRTLAVAVANLRIIRSDGASACALLP
jgi:hypothetical protein